MQEWVGLILIPNSRKNSKTFPKQGILSKEWLVIPNGLDNIKARLREKTLKNGGMEGPAKTPTLLYTKPEPKTDTLTIKIKNKTCFVILKIVKRRVVRREEKQQCNVPFLSTSVWWTISLLNGFLKANKLGQRTHDDSLIQQ